ncbi:MAG: hypothetical protein A3G33_07295 [Omnitrophica bacterium RIFCSPLOWO2_12_FULL_44_17]|uniref:Bacterial type II secretion system protein E domain-containing protein n=1 Tax=Candidatus Danuiimicrobium aquiferis TaxID=1801832 RepID=A0A1G1KYT5_9BACT|nr:MAG: hypothetical protein A3B72_07595 [Omnitrophica bacterium RIFCSPHIGHO2_02_FULL_45_28]OGW89232.1 MAG: hypothetical protein A3E74_08270 [Omnitrophica bacterium RIFCSPHIGHO2_12_FULL_44_12]OGW98031.1 MAG: hypothetical protein A3G33_07295 [Omnitrophica bacterium RIFCSPLOWO2_12_FULL_44_17]OGX03524.1 MAG: hypothetical protein A3J12_02935 [Omnitrophica bacterium RIFCSPLOWO2_02_FULL_44_11]
MKTDSLINIIKKNKMISKEDLDRLHEMQQSSGKKLLHILVDEGIIPEKDLCVLLSTELKIPILNLNAYKIDPRYVEIIPKKIAERYELIPISKIGNTVTIAMSDPLDIYAIDDVKEITQCHVRPVIATSKDIQAAIENYYAMDVKFEDLVEDFDADSVEVVGVQMGVSSEEKFSADEAPVIRMVNLILQDAISNRASDIHFEPYETRLRIRYRIDGALREAHSPPREMYNAILTRIKIVSDLDITEKRLPQDGRFKVRFEHSEIDFRVSILPTYHGEKVVLRILDKSNVKLGLEVLGFTSSSVQKLQEAIKRPYGMVLVTGPTGSGKSTTLYSILNQFNTKDRNIMTIEDPVEYQIQGITQTQANADIGLTFANGLRSLLRQSPDVILVGEIRDGETADIAVKSALTGHLVFSTLHTNNACGAMTRLADMDVEPFLIASSLIAVTAQRLMRRSCPRCRKPYSISADVLARVGGKHDWVRKIQAKRGEGCNYCRNTGYRGRIATMEILVMDEEIQQMVIENRSTQEIEQVARKKGMRSLFEDALMSFENGETTLEEVLRVAAIED